MACEKETLGDWEKRHCQGTGQVRDSIANSWRVGGVRCSEETLPSFLGCKGDGRRIVHSDLQDSVNVTLQHSEISSSGCDCYLVNLVRLTLGFIIYIVTCLLY